MSGSRPTIIYVPGMKPKPPAPDHRAALFRCLVAGIRRTDPAVADELAACPDCFRLVAWPHLFYDEPRDIAPDLPAIDRLLGLDGPEERDIEEAGHWHKRFGRLVYLLCDAFPVLIDWVANDAMKATLTDSQRYFSNEGGIAVEIRALLEKVLREAWGNDEQILLVAHSLGSVIAFDTLWEIGRHGDAAAKLDFVTVGSPLGLNFARHRLLGAHEHGVKKYPHNIRRWWNLSAIGEMTALDRRFANDYREMVKLGLVEFIDDRNGLYNYFRGPDGLNVHKCYGYLNNRDVGVLVAGWWRESRTALAAC